MDVNDSGSGHRPLRDRDAVVFPDPADGVVRQRELSAVAVVPGLQGSQDRKSTRLNSSHSQISYAVFCLKKKKKKNKNRNDITHSSHYIPIVTGRRSNKI